jgi:hypothetical protein
MRLQIDDPRSRAYLVAAIILLVGFVSAVVIYVRAGSAPATLPEFSADYSKRYLRDLQMYGGTGNVLATEFRLWFDSLWHGKRLAYTVAVITLLLSLGHLFFTVYLPPLPSQDSQDDANRG